ncbi:STM4015 family protein [Nocardiopsis changdeensis]|uniref:STM4015 family protein n=1 Tax=Nocardiopsis changdeensis TaxID=2831969 RepID=UPI003F4609E3
MFGPRSHLSRVAEFGGLPVVEFTDPLSVPDEEEGVVHPRQAGEAELADPGGFAWRLTVSEPWRDDPEGEGDPLGEADEAEEADEAGEEEGDEDGYAREHIVRYLDRFTEQVPLEALRALIVGYLSEYDDSYGMLAEPAVEALVGAAPRLAGLRSLFFGEVTSEEQELSWIRLCDLAPLVAALPGLSELVVRGGSEELGLRLESRSLERLTVHSAGLRPEVVEDVCASELPALHRLELWFGSEWHAGGRVTPEGLEPLLSGGAFPRLRHLGLRNVPGLDEWIPVLTGSPVVRDLDVLDLSLGDLSDEGARALVDGASAFRRLRYLDLNHHYLSEEVEKQVAGVFRRRGTVVDVSARREPAQWKDGPHRYTAVTE